MLTWLKNLFGSPEPAGPPRLIQRFDESQATISSTSIVTDEGGGKVWLKDIKVTFTPFK